jgi:hypothetical protein
MPGNKEFIPINVESYSGYRADEYPKCFYRDNERYEIKEILDRWYQGYQDPAMPAADYFRVETSSGQTCIIRHDLSADAWFLCP